MAKFLQRENAAAALAELFEQRGYASGLGSEVKTLAGSSGALAVFARLLDVWSAALRADRELETTFAILVGLASNLSDADSAQAFTRLADAAGAKEVPNDVKFRLLAVAYNSCATDAGALRLRLFTEAAAAARACDGTILAYIVRQAREVAAESARWNLTPSQQRSLFVTFADLAAANARIDDEIDFLATALERCSDVDADGLRLAERLVARAVSSGTFREYERVTECAQVKALAGNAAHAWAHQLLTAFVRGSVADVQAALAAAGAKSAASVDANATIDKSRVLALCAACGGRDSLSYAEAAAALGVSEDAVERWVVKAMRAGMLDARLNEPKRTISVRNVVKPSFSSDDWRSLANRLDTWKANLQALAGAVSQHE